MLRSGRGGMRRGPVRGMEWLDSMEWMVYRYCALLCCAVLCGRTVAKHARTRVYTHSPLGLGAPLRLSYSVYRTCLVWYMQRGWVANHARTHAQRNAHACIQPSILSLPAQLSSPYTHRISSYGVPYRTVPYLTFRNTNTTFLPYTCTFADRQKSLLILRFPPSPPSHRVASVPPISCEGSGPMPFARVVVGWWCRFFFLGGGK